MKEKQKLLLRRTTVRSKRSDSRIAISLGAGPERTLESMIVKSDQRSVHRIKPSIADDVGEGGFPQLMVVVTDQEVSICIRFQVIYIVIRCWC